MRRIGLVTATAVMAVIGGVATYAVPTADAAAKAAPAASINVTIGGVPSICFHDGTKWAVRQSGINIRSTPGGSSEGGIPKGATFLSRGPSDQAGWTCRSVATPDGTHWMFGVAKVSRIHGWVGRKWLKQTGTGPGD
jgi:hypothetical protein